MSQGSPQDYDDEDHTNVFVKFLPSDIDDSRLRSLFTHCGSIVSAKVMVNQNSGESLGYGFVRFSKAYEARRAVEMMAGHRIGAKTLLCKLADTYSFPDPSCNLYIKPLPLGTSDASLRDIFSRYGRIQTVKIVDVRVAESVVGFVKYDSVESATNAIEDLNGTKVFPNFPPLLVKYAETDVQRAVRKANNHPAHKLQHSSSETHISIETSTIQITTSSEINDNTVCEFNNSECEYEQYNNDYYVNDNNEYYPPSIPSPTSPYYGFQYYFVPVCVSLPCSSYMQQQPFYSPPFSSPSFYYTK